MKPGSGDMGGEQGHGAYAHSGVKLFVDDSHLVHLVFLAIFS